MSWTKENRPRCNHHNHRYLSDLASDEWHELESLLPIAQRISRTRTRAYSLQAIINGIRHVQRCGISCIAMPKDLLAGRSSMAVSLCRNSASLSVTAILSSLLHTRCRPAKIGQSQANTMWLVSGETGYAPSSPLPR